MKHILPLLVCVTVLLSMSVPAFAVETEDPETAQEDVAEPVTVQAEADDKQIVVNVAVNNASSEASEGETTLDDAAQIVEEDTVTYTAYSVRALDESETEVPEDSIPAVLTALFGDYTPRTQTVTEYLADGTEVSYQEVVPGLAGLDWLWIASVALFGMGLYCVFRVIGGCIKWI